MKSIVIYSFPTGNTKQVAEAIAAYCQQVHHVYLCQELPSDVSSYDLVFARFWVIKGRLIKKPVTYSGTLHNPYIGVVLQQQAYHLKWHMRRRV